MDTHSLRIRQRLEEAVERGGCAHWNSHSERIARWRHAPQNLRIETDDLIDRGATCLGNRRQRRRRTHPYGVIGERLECSNLHPIPMGLFGDECRGDELRHIFSRLTREEVLVGEGEESVVAARSLEVVRVSR